MNVKIKFSLVILLFFGISINTSAQVFTNKEVGKKAAEDTTRRTEQYPYSLPILGKKAFAAGYDLPYSAGISVQYFGSKSDVLIDNLKVGFNNGTLYDLDEIVRFDKARATASAITVRPDIWLFPFLNVYGILGTSQASTDVGFGVWITDTTGVDQEILNASTVVEFQTTTFGLGLTPTIGVGGGFLALDLNVAWTDVPQLAKPARTFVFGPRFGKSFKLKKPGSTIAVWAGGFRVDLASQTDGSLDLSEILPEDGGDLSIKIEDGLQKVDDAQVQVDTWWAGLTPVEQLLPSNKYKYESASNILARAGEVLVAAEGAVDNISTSTVQYSMEKQVADKWNFIVGAQYQINKHLMLRFEAGFLGSRNQIMSGLQYRFGL